MPTTANPFLDVKPVTDEDAETLSTDELFGDRMNEVGPPAPLGTVGDGLEWVRSGGRRDRLNVVGLHGGAGASTVARLIGEDLAYDAGTVIPEGGAVLFVARTSGCGVARVQEAARAWSAHELDGINVVGLVLVASLPKLPKDVLRPARVASRMFPMCWHLGFRSDWHAADVADLDHLDLRTRRIRRALREAGERAIAGGAS